MYPCQYGNYYYPTIFDTEELGPDMTRAATAPTMPGVPPMTAPGYYMPGGMGMPMGPMPGSMGMPMGQMPGSMGAPMGLFPKPIQPLEDEFMETPVPGTTAGMPTESVTPAPLTIPMPVDFSQEPGPPVTTDIGYTQAYLRTQIGKRVKIEFLIGTNSLTDRIGTLVDVGISYVLIRLTESDDILLGDIYSIKFVTFYK